MSNYFTALNAINVNGKTEKKNGLTYLSWAWAWGEFKKVCPDATYEVVKFDGKPYYYDPATGYMCYTKVTAGGITHEMWLPVMDGANKAMKSEAYIYTVKNQQFKYATLDRTDGKYYDKYGNEQQEFIEKVCEAATMFDINKTIMRCLTKNLAMFGLGLYIYAGEDLPEDETPVKEEPKGGYGYKESIQGLKNLDEIAATANYCAQCGTLIRDGKKKSGAVWAAVDIASYTKSKFGRCLCQSCASDASKQEN